MTWIVLAGVRPYDGRYEFDLETQELTTREWGWLKRLAGYMPLTLEQGFDGADPELFACFAVIALRRAGKIEPRDVPQVFDRIQDAPFGTTVRLESDTADEEVEGNPPLLPASSSRNGDSSGAGSPTSSESPALTPEASGTPASATSPSVPATLGT